MMLWSRNWMYCFWAGDIEIFAVTDRKWRDMK